MLVLLAAWQEGGIPNQAAQFPKTPEAVVFLHGDAISLKEIRIVCFRKSPSLTNSPRSPCLQRSSRWHRRRSGAPAWLVTSAGLPGRNERAPIGDSFMSAEEGPLLSTGVRQIRNQWLQRLVNSTTAARDRAD